MCMYVNVHTYIPTVKCGTYTVYTTPYTPLPVFSDCCVPGIMSHKMFKTLMRLWESVVEYKDRWVWLWAGQTVCLPMYVGTKVTHVYTVYVQMAAAVRGNLVGQLVQ